MSDLLTGKVWNLDNVVGMVTTTPVCIHAIRVRFSTAGIGSCIISTSDGTANKILDLVTTDASTAAVWNTVLSYSFGDQFFNGIQKVVCVNVTTIQLVTSTPR